MVTDAKALDSLADDVLLMQKIFKDMGVFAYPAFGTLLGIVREGDFIKDDTDIDMCWHSTKKTKDEVIKDTIVMYHRARKKRIMAFVHNYVGTMKVQVTPEMRRGGTTYMDMCVSWTENDDYWINIFGNYGGVSVNPREAKLRGKTVLIPEDAERFLEFTYGDWRTPKSSNEKYKAGHIKWGSYLLK